jgi:Bacterial Ig-like domain
MSRPMASVSIVSIVSIVSVAAALISPLSACSLVSLEALAIDTQPAVDGEVAPAEGPLRVAFSIEPQRTTAERAFKLSSAAGTSAGDFVWSGNEFAFYPIPPLKKGYRWTLSVIGRIKATDGREFDVSKTLSFYAGSRASLLTLDSFSPTQGATVSTAEALSFTFSRAVDGSLFRRDFSLSPATDYDLAWSADGRVATLSPKAHWTTLSTYTWQVKAELADGDGLGLARSYDGAFVVQASGRALSVVSVRPAIFTNGSFSPIAAGLDQLAYRDAIYVTFSEEPTRESVADAIKLTPSVKGRVLQDGPMCFAFVPDEGYAARTRYKLCLLSTISNLAGSTMCEDYLAWFSPQVIDLSVARASIAAGSTITDFGDAQGYGFRPQVPDGSTLIAVEFNAPIIDAGWRDRIVTLVSCASLFPSALSPALKSAQWVGATRLELSYAGFSASTVSKTYYYKFLVPGGTSGISDGAGGTMEKDLWFVLFSE